MVAKPNTPTAPLLVNGGPPVFAVRLVDGGPAFPAVPAVAGTQLLPDVFYPLVARIPADALAAAADRIPHVVFVRMAVDVPANYPAQLDLVAADLAVRPGGHVPLGVALPDTAAAVVPLPPALAPVSARLLDASGQPLVPNKNVPHGRAILDIAMDAPAGQRTSGGLAGLAGFEVWLDGAELVGVPTAMDGPGIGGEWQVAFDTANAPPGPHTLDIRTFGATRGVAFGETFVAFILGS
jgi:hypothetical protein